MFVFETDRLHLRPLGEADLDALAEICADEETMRYLGGTMSRADTWRHIAMLAGHQVLRGYTLLGVEEKATGGLIGRVGLFYPEGWPDLEVGWLIARSRWGHGFATEAAMPFLRHAFDVMGVDHVCSIIHPENRASIRVAEKLGETFERMWTIRGIDARLYGIDRKTWSARLRDD